MPHDSKKKKAEPENMSDSEASDERSESDSQSEQDGGARKTKTAGKKSAPAKKSGSKRTGSKTSTKTSKGGRKGAQGKKTAGKKTRSTRGSTRREEGRDRYFKLIDPDTQETFGRYTGDTPKQAASKGYTKLLQKYKEDKKTPPKTSIIFLRESTRGSNKKIYGYSAMRQKLDEPQNLVITDNDTGKEKTITYHYRNKIKKVPVPEKMTGGARGRAGSKSKKSAGRGSKSAGAKKGAAKGSGSKRGSTGRSSSKASARGGAKGKGKASAGKTKKASTGKKGGVTKGRSASRNA